MLDRERIQSTNVVAPVKHAEHGVREPLASTDEQANTRVHRTTMVPQPLQDLDEQPSSLVRPLRLDLGTELDLTESELEESELEESEPEESEPEESELGTSSAFALGHSSARSAVASSVSLSDTAKQLILPGRAIAPSQRPQAYLQRPEPDDESARADKWYLRVQLDTDVLAELWIRERTPHNVLVWSDDMRSWVPLLTVRELRDAIRDAHDAHTRHELCDSSFVFVNTQTPSTEHRPLPAPKLPQSLGPPRPVRTTSLWSQPKARTISNVPPPLLTTAVPVLGSVKSQVSQAHSPAPPLVRPRSVPPAVAPNTAAMSTVPPVVKSIPVSAAAEIPVASLPSIPRPARVPDIDQHTRVARSTAHQPATPDAFPSSSTLAMPTRRDTSRVALIARATSRFADLPLVHVERALWLSAGVAISAAIMLLMRSPANDLYQAASRIGSSVEAPTTRSGITPTNASPALADVHRVEDLPVVSSGRSAVSSGSQNGSAKPSSGARHGVQPADIQLASAANTLGPSNPTPSAGGLDTGAARRVLTGSASRAGRCTSDGPASGSVLITFAPSGFVQSASISALSGRGVNVACVLRAFQEARVSPFSGGPVTVRKGFQI